MNYHFELIFFIAILLKSIWAKPDKTSISEAEPWIVHFPSDWFDIVSQLHKRSHRMNLCPDFQGIHIYTFSQYNLLITNIQSVTIMTYS